MIKRIHVNKHNIASNRKHGTRLPVFTTKTYKGNHRGDVVEILDDQGGLVARLVYRPDKPLSCGAVAWIETTNTVVVDGGVVG